MKRLFTFLLILIFCSGFSFADEPKKIPRRVYFGLSNKTFKGDIFLLLPDFLYTRISSLKPIVRVNERQDADSSVIVTINKMDSNKILVEVSLFDKKKLILSNKEKFNSIKTNPERLTNFIIRVSKQISPYMKNIKPKVRIVKNVKEKKLKKIVSKVQYADKLNKEFEFTLWGSGITRIPSVIPYDFTTNKPTDRFSYIFPLILDVGWYYNKNTGILFSLYFDKNDIISFALTSTVEHTDNGYDEINPIGVSRSDNEFYMVGIGYSYRSLDFISAEFNILEYMGAVKITAIDNIEVHYWDNNYNALTGLTIPAGETKWIFYDFFSLQFVLAINPLPWVSIKTKVAININLSTISKPNFGTYYYSRDLNTLLLNFFQIGMAFKI